MIKVIVSNPSFHPSSIYLPYLWGRFRSYFKQQYPENQNICWKNPIFFGDSVDILCEGIDFKNINVLLLSCYVWNIDKNFQIAQRAKIQNPNCYIIAGGPDIPYFSTTYFDEHPYLDAFCISEGEPVVSNFLYRYENNMDINNIPGLVTVKNNKRARIIPPKMELKHLQSPWIEYHQEYMEFSQQIKNKNKRVNIGWETNRGCPYNCSFCDWGSATNSKIKRFDFNLLQKEAQLFSDYKTDFIFIADANYGIFNEDLELVRTLVTAKQNTGYPSSVTFSSAKNKKLVVNECYKILFENQMIEVAQIGFQHTDSEVLAAINRSNIKNEKLMEELQESFEAGIPLVGVLILGNPGDTQEKWRQAFYDLLEIGFHDDIRVHDFMLLPNAPALDPKYVEKWKIKYINRLYRESFNDRSSIAANFISSCKTFNEQDYIEMQMFSAFIQSFHIMGVTKFISLYLYHKCNIHYKEFYNELYEHKYLKKLFSELYVHMNKYMNGNEQEKLIVIDGVLLSPFNYLFCIGLENIENIMNIVRNICSRYIDNEILEDLILLQKRVLIGWWSQEPIQLKYNLIDFFKKTLTLSPNKKLTDFEIVKKQQIIDNKQTNVGLYSHINISMIKDKETWLNSNLLRNSNMRHKINYYAEIFE